MSRCRCRSASHGPDCPALDPGPHEDEGPSRGPTRQPASAHKRTPKEVARFKRGLRALAAKLRTVAPLLDRSSKEEWWVTDAEAAEAVAEMLEKLSAS